MTLSIEQLKAFPACAARIGWNNTRLDDPLMNAYWASVIVADFCDDEALEAFGGFNFANRSEANGFLQLSRLEKCIRARRHKVDKQRMPPEVVAMLGARGVKTSMLSSAADYWEAAETLFPGHIERSKSLITLHRQIASIPKKERKRLADANLRRLKPEWLSGASAHLAKLQ